MEDAAPVLQQQQPPQQPQQEQPQQKQQAAAAAAQATEAQLELLKQQAAQYAQWVLNFLRVNAGLPAEPTGGSPADASGGGSPTSAAAAAAAAAQQEEEELAALAPYALHADVPALCASLRDAAVAKTYLTALKAWSEAVRELEHRCRDFSAVPPLPAAAAAAAAAADAAAAPSPPGGGVPQLQGVAPAAPAEGAALQGAMEAFSQAACSAIEGLAAALYAADVAAFYAPAAQQAAPILTAAAASIDACMQECRRGLYARLTEDLLHGLEASGWPPPLAPSAPAAPAEAQKGAGGPAAAAFTGWQPAHLPQLQVLVACLTRLQQAVQRAAFQQLQEDSSREGGSAGAEPQEGPLLWAASAALVPGLQARLQAQFAPHTAAGRLDRPEWMLRTVLRLVQENAAHAAALQPGLAAAGLQGVYLMAIEFARGMREAAKVVLRTARLPAMQEAWERGMEGAGELWHAQIEQAIDFELKLAPFLGVPQEAVAAGVLPDALRASVLGAVTDNQESMGCWVAVEHSAAQARLQELLQDERAWLPAQDDEDDDDPVSGLRTPAAFASLSLASPAASAAGALTSPRGSAPGLVEAAGSSGSGWQREFNAPRVAEAVVEMVAALLALSRSTPTAEAQKALLDGVAGPLLSSMIDQMTQIVDQASALNSILSEAWAPKVGACVAAARYLHHTLSELLEGPALSRLHAAAAAAAAQPADAGGEPAAAAAADAGTSGGRSGMASADGSAADLASSGRGGVGDAEMRPGFEPASLPPPVLASGVATLGSLHREWGLRIAQALAQTFGRAAVGYREAVEAADDYPTHSGAADTVTPVLAPAMALLQAGLHALAPSLDAPSFRDIWRAVTVPVNRFLFNYVATEAYFSAAGAHQFGVDCAGMVAVFSPFTKRPAAHFRETLAAAQLLALGDEGAAEVVRRASARSVAGEPLWRDPWLAELGVGCLSAQQCVMVVERRLG